LLQVIWLPPEVHWNGTVVGNVLGASLVLTVGDAEGKGVEGLLDGSSLGKGVDTEGRPLGWPEGSTEGCGDTLGVSDADVGFADGTTDGSVLGKILGVDEGFADNDGETEGCDDPVGGRLIVGKAEGHPEELGSSVKGKKLGALVGTSDTLGCADNEGETEGCEDPVGCRLRVGPADGASDGSVLGASLVVGKELGVSEGASEALGCADNEGETEGCDDPVGCWLTVGPADGASDGSVLGAWLVVGPADGVSDGSVLGSSVATEGLELGTFEGSTDGCAVEIEGSPLG
jgi:hypothetical protein